MLNWSRLFSWSIIGLVLLLACTSTQCLAATTTFYVVRHAERADEPGSDRLSLVGMRRAEELRSVLSSVPLWAVYSSKTRRTWQTATPTALAAGKEITPYGQETHLVPPEGWKKWAAAKKAKHAGENVLIVGHSDTVQDIIRALGGEGNFPVRGNDDLFVVTIDDGGVNVKRQRYPVIERLGQVTFNGDIHEPKDISAIAATKNHKFLVIGSDETTQVQVLKRNAEQYDVKHSIELPSPKKKEIDIEGITRHGSHDTFYVVGSHSWRRKKVLGKKHQDKTYEEIKKRFEVKSPDREENRDRLLRLKLDSCTGELVGGSLKEITLRDVLNEHLVLGHFSKIPGKENGIDIEGIASDGEKLYLGFRGPVFRHGFAPVLVFSPDDLKRAELRYVALDGQGIRDMTRVEDGFLVIAGPVGDAPLPCKLYFWDGNDCLPGKRSAGHAPIGTVVLLGTIPDPVDVDPKKKDKAKAEGIVVLNENKEDQSYEFLIVYDGVKGGKPTRFRVVKP